MLKDKLKKPNGNQLKIIAVYVILIISNIALFIGLHIHYTNIGSFNQSQFNEIAAIIATMCILGYISTKLPKINDMGESSLYGLSYFLIICIIGIITSYFTGKMNISSSFGPYLEMFEMTCAVIIFVLIANNLKAFREMINEKFTRRNQLICLAVFIPVGLLASYACININGLSANVRCLVVMIGGLFGGPVVGIPVGIISGAYRYSIGGPTAIPCTISTVISGIVGSLIFIWNGKRFPKVVPALLLAFLFTGFEMVLVVMMTPPEISFNYIKSVYTIMLLGSLSGMFLFIISFKESKNANNPEITYEKQKIRELEKEFERHEAENENLRNEIESLKKEIEELKK